MSHCPLDGTVRRKPQGAACCFDSSVLRLGLFSSIDDFRDAVGETQVLLKATATTHAVTQDEKQAC